MTARWRPGSAGVLPASCEARHRAAVRPRQGFPAGIRSRPWCPRDDGTPFARRASMTAAVLPAGARCARAATSSRRSAALVNRRSRKNAATVARWRATGSACSAGVATRRWRGVAPPTDPRYNRDMTASYPNYAAAHRRHWKDATVLFACERWANADQLYGFSAECGLKAIMVGLGMRINKKGAPENSQYRKHVHELWPVFQEFAEGRAQGVWLRELPDGDPFSNWSHRDRYADDVRFDYRRVNPHRKATRRICYMMQLFNQENES